MSRVPRLLVPGLPAAGRVPLPDDEAAHVVRVLRARPGDAVRLFDGRGREAECVVVEVGRDGAVAEIVRELEVPRIARRVVLAAAMPRGDRMEWLVEKAVEAGVACVLPIAAERSARKDAGPNTLRRLARAAAEAAKQCGRADVPDVAEPMPLAEAIARTAGTTRLAAMPGADLPLHAALPPEAPVAIFVGPEGGFGPDEAAALTSAGAAPFGLGPLVLRVETAAVVAVHVAAHR